VRDEGAERAPLQGTLDHQLESAFGNTERPHAVMDPARAEACLSDAEAIAFARDQVRHRYADVGERQLRVTAVFVVVVSEDLHTAMDLHA